MLTYPQHRKTGLPPAQESTSVNRTKRALQIG
jgi:hypothetical protein